ncbi:MAG TPA: glutamate 5-kinase [Atribacteraceae bacterium]|nr:glutamate 5-kinase [Atribacteraceae bacterium]
MFSDWTKLIVVKVGSSLLVDGNNISRDRLGQLAENIVRIRQRGKQMILVSSGAMACGMSVMGIREMRRDIPFKQAMAAIGQVILMERYSEVFASHSVPVAQVLLAPEDTHNRSKYLNVRNTFESLLTLGVLPIVNENDTVAVEEIKFGDNDRLSALVASLVDAHLLVILSDIEGLYTTDPKKDPHATFIRKVDYIDKMIEDMAGGQGSVFSAGGMKSKITAARIATWSGIGTIIASGKDFSILSDILSGKERGTYFSPLPKALRSRKRWIGFGMICQGTIIVDEGAEKAISGNKSLLPAGITGSVGSFEPGDCVEIRGKSGRLIARGLVNYSSDELKAISGCHSDQLQKKWPDRVASPEVVHVDNLALFPEDEAKGERESR